MAMLSDGCARLFGDSRLLYDEVGLLRGVAPGASGLVGDGCMPKHPKGMGRARVYHTRIEGSEDQSSSIPAPSPTTTWARRRLVRRRI
jgi:hypothetical protein